MDIKKEFQNKVEEVQKLPKQPNEVLLKLYALYKQASIGDVQGKKPGMLDIRGRAKYSAWEELKGMPSEKAMQDYINTVDQLQKHHSAEPN